MDVESGKFGFSSLHSFIHLFNICVLRINYEQGRQGVCPHGGSSFETYITAKYIRLFKLTWVSHCNTEHRKELGCFPSSLEGDITSILDAQERS